MTTLSLCFMYRLFANTDEKRRGIDDGTICNLSAMPK